MNMSRDILLSLIDPDPKQPRRHFDQTRLRELAQSLATQGQIVPITVRPAEGGRFIIVQGERRYRAAHVAGLRTLRSEISEVDADAAFWIALTENVQRSDLTPMEEARAFECLVAQGHTQAEIGKRLGKTQSYVAQKLRLLKSPTQVQGALDRGAMSEGIARQLLRLEPERHEWGTLVKRCLQDGWTVRYAKNYVDYQTLVFYPEHWPVASKFQDLVEFEKRLDEERQRGYIAPEEKLRTERALGQHLLLAQKIWDAGAPAVAALALEEFSLSALNSLRHYIDRGKACNAAMLDTLKTWVVLHTVEDAMEKVNLGEFEDKTGTALWHELIERLSAWFDANWSPGLVDAQEGQSGGAL